MRDRLLLATILSAFFLYGFDGNVVNVALPTIQRSLGAGQLSLQLVVIAYVFAYATCVTVGGRLGDVFGQRRLFLAGMAAFIGFSGICALAQTPTQLVAARALQGLAAAVMVPQVVALLNLSYRGSARTSALAWYSIVGGVSGLSGQILGGALLQLAPAWLSWRAVFLINVPVGFCMLATATRVVPLQPRRNRTEVDLLGGVGLLAALSLLVTPLLVGQHQGWRPWQLALLGAGIVTLGACLRYESRLAAHGRTPLLPLALLSRPVFALGLLVNALFMVNFGALLFVLGLTLQNGLSQSPLHAGLAFAPMALLAAPASLYARRHIPAREQRILLSGVGVTAAGVLIAALALQVQAEATSIWWLVGSIAVIGLGNGLMLPCLLSTPLAQAPTDSAGAASGLFSATSQLAAVLGVTLIGGRYLDDVGRRPGTSGYATAAVGSLHLDLIVLCAMAALVATHAFTRRNRRRESVVHLWEALSSSSPLVERLAVRVEGDTRKDQVDEADGVAIASPDSVAGVTRLTRGHNRLTEAELRQVSASWVDGESIAVLAARHKVHPTTIRRHLFRLGLRPGRQ